MSVATFSRTSPSPRYRELIDLYRTMHQRGEQFHELAPEDTYAGQSLLRHVETIRNLVEMHAARSLLDYGSGKGRQYAGVAVKLPDGRRFESVPAYWGVDQVTCYDPAYEPYARLPRDQFDGVISTDVLEHCPQPDVGWVVDELFSFARRFVYANVACYPAHKRLANGENAHCTIQAPQWWGHVFRQASLGRPDIRYYVQLDEVVAGAEGQWALRPAYIEG